MTTFVELVKIFEAFSARQHTKFARIRCSSIFQSSSQKGVLWKSSSVQTKYELFPPLLRGPGGHLPHQAGKLLENSINMQRLKLKKFSCMFAHCYWNLAFRLWPELSKVPNTAILKEAHSWVFAVERLFCGIRTPRCDFSLIKALWWSRKGLSSRKTVISIKLASLFVRGTLNGIQNTKPFYLPNDSRARLLGSYGLNAAYD